MLAAVLGYAFVDGYTKFLLLAAVQEACFAGYHSGHYGAIDITTSAPQLRKHGICMLARLGMLVGVVLGIGMYKMYGFRYGDLSVRSGRTG